MNVLKNLFVALIAIISVSMIACQGDAKDARDQARENITTDAQNTTSADPNATAATNPDGTPIDAVPTGPTTTMVFEETDFDFGTVNDGEKVKHTYKFKNTGNEPLIISSAKGSCGCTVPKWPTDPIAPGAMGQIDVEFDSKGKPGKQTKRVTVTANTVPAQSFLNITGMVNKDPNAPATTTPVNPGK
ncbi:MAG: DUF1573 domain-containing protein [Bacteroidota bacterium]|nr:DUF1573 domain-containing protein [Bacteroidota bacterium]